MSSSVNAIYGGQYLSVQTVRSEKLMGRPLAIEEANEEMFTGKDGKTNNKIVLALKGVEKKLSLNKVNASILSESYGDNTDGWIGKNIRLSIGKVQFGKDIVDGISVSADASA